MEREFAGAHGPTLMSTATSAGPIQNSKPDASQVGAGTIVASIHYRTIPQEHSMADCGWVSPLISAGSGLIGALGGVGLAGWLATSRDRVQRRQAVVREQVDRFYSPVVGWSALIRASTRSFGRGKPDFGAKRQDSVHAIWQVGAYDRRRGVAWSIRSRLRKLPRTACAVGATGPPQSRCSKVFREPAGGTVIRLQEWRNSMRFVTYVAAALVAVGFSTTMRLARAAKPRS